MCHSVLTVNRGHPESSKLWIHASECTVHYSPCVLWASCLVIDTNPHTQHILFTTVKVVRSLKYGSLNSCKIKGKNWIYFCRDMVWYRNIHILKKNVYMCSVHWPKKKKIVSFVNRFDRNVLFWFKVLFVENIHSWYLKSFHKWC